MNIPTSLHRRFVRLATRLSALLLLVPFFMMSGCANVSDESSATEGNGELVIGLTDAKGDFASYTVDVISLTLTKASGEVVQALPLTTRVDFAQYTEMTEFLTVATISSGLYVQAEMLLDYSAADIQVEDANGDAVPVSNIVDSDGNAIGELRVAVKLEGRNALRIVAGVPAQLTLDFDLKASNSVTFDPTVDSPSLTVEPFLLAELDVEKFKSHRLRGPLAGVAVADSTFDVIIRPFHRRMSRDDVGRHFGTLTVTSDDRTIFEVDGESYQGNAGLTALASQPRFSATLVRGDLKLNPRRFVAREVYAGNSVPGGSLDVVTGNVIARTGDTLTVKGATLVRADGSVIFNDEVSVQLTAQTVVKRQLDLAADYAMGDISVGQRLRIFGTVSSDAEGKLEIVAEHVQMRFTTLRGTVVGTAVIQIYPTPALPLVIELQAIDGRQVSLFDFRGTGSEASNDADPLNYEIDQGNLDVSLLADGAPIKLRGFATPFGTAPADFSAQSVFDITQIQALMVVGWEPASSTAIASLSAEGMRLNLDGVGRFHHVSRGRVAVDLTGLAAQPSIVPTADGKGMFGILQAGAHQRYKSFASFADDLAARIAAGAQVRHIAARGVFDDVTVQTSADYVVVKLE